MSFLRVNGWAIPLLDGSPEEEHIIGGDFARAFSGNPIRDERFDKRVWRGTTPPVTEMVGLAIAGAVRGLGHVWPFNSDLYSSKGLTPGATVGSLRLCTAANGAAVVDSNNVAESKFGAGALAVEPAATNILSQNKRDGTEDGTTTGFAAVVGGAIASSTTQKMQGSRSLRVITAASGDGAETTTETASAATAYAGSCYVYTASDRSVKLELIDSVGTVVSTTFTARAGKWTRLDVTGTTAGGATTIKLRFKDNAAGGATFYLDELQIEAGASATTWANATRAAGSLAYPTSVLSAASTGVTFNAWLRMAAATAGPDRYILRMRAAANYHEIILRRNGGANPLNFYTSDGAASADNLAYTPAWDGAWHMVTAVLRTNPESGEVAKSLYFDGVLQGSITPAGKVPTLSAITNVFLGHDGDSSVLTATGTELLDDVAILPYAAPAELVTAWYAMGKAMPSLSRVYVDGDAMPDSALTVLAEGKADSSKYIAATSTSFRSNLRMVDLELWEV